jgi:hypothetical protein
MHLARMVLLHFVQISHPLVASGSHSSRGTTKQSLSGSPLSFAYLAVFFLAFPLYGSICVPLSSCFYFDVNVD